MNNIVFIKELELPSIKDGVQCDYCGNGIHADHLACIYMVSDVLKYVHAEERTAYAATFTTTLGSEDEDDAARAVAASSEDMACPYCGITVNPKDGIAFKDASNPNYSLGNHKKWCASKPSTPSQTQTVAPATVAPAPVAPRSPAPAPTPSPSPAMPVEYSQSVWQQGENARTIFVNKAVPPHLYWNERVTDEIWPIVLAAYADRQPVLFIGASGTGKSVLAHAIARHFEVHHVGALNFSEDMRMDSLYGNPVPTGNGGIGWNDGIMTKAARWGGIALLEEFTRSGVAATRSMSTLDQVERGLYLPENPFEQEVAVHPDFWVMATANPVGLGYTAKELDTAMRSRFLILDANFPFANERKVIEPLIGADRADRLVDLFETLRLGGKFFPNTRDLVQVARLLYQGVPFQRAAAVALTPKCPTRSQEGVRMLVEQYSI